MGNANATCTRDKRANAPTMYSSCAEVPHMCPLCRCTRCCRHSVVHRIINILFVRVVCGRLGTFGYAHRSTTLTISTSSWTGTGAYAKHSHDTAGTAGAVRCCVWFLQWLNDGCLLLCAATVPPPTRVKPCIGNDARVSRDALWNL